MPYLFMNNSDEIIDDEDNKVDRDKRDFEMVAWQSMIDDDNEPQKFQTLFGRLYKDLLESIVDADFHKLKKMCESKLYAEFKDGIEYL